MAKKKEGRFKLQLHSTRWWNNPSSNNTFSIVKQLKSVKKISKDHEIIVLLYLSRQMLFALSEAQLEKQPSLEL